MQVQGVEMLDYEGAEIQLVVTSDAERSMRIRSCAKEPETVEWIRSFEPSSVFYDIGSNVGAYSLIADVLGHTVYAFEPHQPTFERLKLNISINGSEVVPYPVLLTEFDGDTPFSWTSGEPGTALHQIGVHSGMTVVMSDCRRLDTAVSKFGLPRPDYIKLDVDGHEYEVLQGAPFALEIAKSILVEFDASLKAHDAKVHGALEDHGFAQTGYWRHGATPIANVRYDR